MIETDMLDSIPPRFSVIPVRGKIPLVKWQDFIVRRPTTEELAGWQTSLSPFDRGIVTGPVSGIFVLDIDGAAGLEEARRLGLPRTPVVRTKKGWHYYFKWTAALDNKVTTRVRIGNEMDVRGHSGYVVFYGWEVAPWVAPLASPPQWLLDLLPDKQMQRESIQPVEFRLTNIEEGNRNQSFTSLAGSLRSRGFGAEALFEFLRPRAAEVNFSLDELRIICESVARYSPRQAVETTPLEDQTDSFIEFMKDQAPTSYLIDGLVADNSINIIAGLQESRKSWILLDLAMSLASGTQWLNQYECKTKKVLLIDQERPKSEMQRRLTALRNARGLNASDFEGRLILRSKTTFRVNLDRSFEHLSAEIERLRPDVLLVDSLKTFVTCNVESNQEMQSVFEKLKELRNKHHLTIVLLHHENKGAYARKREEREITAENIAGASSINEVPEGLFVTVAESEFSTLYHVKNSYGLKKLPMTIRVEDTPKGIQVNSY